MEDVSARDVELDLVAYYDEEAEDRAYRPLEPERLAAREEFLVRTGAVDRLLEIGSGAGRDVGFFVERGIEAVAVDLSREQLKHAARRGASATVASVRALPFAAATFDAVWTMSSLMHVPNSAIVGALAEVRRVLSPGALVAVGVWGGADVEERTTGDRFGPPRLFSRRSDARWQSLLGAVGRIEEFRTWADGLDTFWYQWALVRRP